MPLSEASEPVAEPSAPPNPSRARLAGLTVLVAAAVAVALRVTSWPAVFTARGVRFVADGDPYYHARRAWMILEPGGSTWRDPLLNYPAGADIPWPPLFDALLAGVTWLAGLGNPTAGTLALVAAWYPAILGVATVGVGALLAGELFGRAVTLAAALLLAASVPLVIASELGRPDQHVLEVLLFAAVTLAFARGLEDRRPRWGAVLLLGVLLALSFWNWLGSALTLLVLGVACVADGIVFGPEGPSSGRAARLLAAGAASASALLLLSIGIAGPPGALGRLTLGGISGFQPLVCALCAALAASLLLVRARSRLARAALLVVVPTGFGLLSLALLPSLREPILRGLNASRAGDAWYGSISEFQPLLFSGTRPVGEELSTILGLFGLLPALAFVGLLDAVGRLRRGAERGPAIVVALVVAAIFAVATASMMRFLYYAALPLSVFAALGLDAIRRRLSARRAWLGPTAAATVGLFALAPTARELTGGDVGSIPVGVEEALTRLRTAQPQGDRRAVLAWWDIGHHVLWHSNRPVVASPFGTEGGAGAMEDLARFFTESDPTAAELLLARRGVQYVLLDDPFEKAVLVLGHGLRAGGGGFIAGRGSVMARPGDLVIVGLFKTLGTAVDGPNPRPALDAFRVVDEVPSEKGPARLFEFVPGVKLEVRGARAGARVTARVPLQSPSGRRGDWWTFGVADAGGNAQLRLPYATGWNGRFGAGAWSIEGGARPRSLATAESQVLAGSTVALDLGSGAQRPR